VVFAALPGWLFTESHDGGDLGLAERLTTSAQACWPFAVALRRGTSGLGGKDRPTGGSLLPAPWQPGLAGRRVRVRAVVSGSDAGWLGILTASACSSSLNEFPIRSRPYAGLEIASLHLLPRTRRNDDCSYGDSQI
jgi:hypothetical protein